MSGDGFDRLTRRQLAALRHRCAGLTNAEAGRRMFVTERTVRNHITAVALALAVHLPTRTTGDRVCPSLCYLLGRHDRAREGPGEQGVDPAARPEWV